MSIEKSNVGPAKRKRRTWVFGTLMLVIGLAVAGWGGRNVYDTAQIGAAYIAKHTCSCIFVAGRTADACSHDYDAEAARLLTVQPQASSVTVSALAGVFSARAQFEDGFGCHLVN